ncbi:MAG: prenyltransferase [Candidatus Omnitrophota bacterium]|nr:MAG: prenyltransferase [Candidatus Omnitrophota bacterium]
MGKAHTVELYIRALRLPFITASVFPFLFGSFLTEQSLRFIPFLLGLFSVIATHLGANLLNDYADSKTGADWQDKKFYTFFGGSKLIQEGLLSEKFYRNLSICCFVFASLCILSLAVILKSVAVIGYFLLILLLGISYSYKPFRFSYHRLGEIFLFILFGPVPVMGGYFIQTQVFPTAEGFLLSLPFGFFTTAILFANEVPDFPGDSKVGKFTWVSLMGQKNAYKFYFLLVLFGFFSIVLNYLVGYLGALSLVSLVFIFIALKATSLLKKHSHDKMRLLDSSRLTIALQSLVSIVLIIDVLV